MKKFLLVLFALCSGASAADLTLSANADTFLQGANFGAMRTSLGVAIGTNVEAFDADLDLWAAITPGTGVGTWLATPSSSNLRAVLTDEVGSGKAVFNDQPTFTVSLQTTSTSFSLFNSTATTVNFAGEATALNIGFGGILALTDTSATLTAPLTATSLISGGLVLGTSFKLWDTDSSHTVTITEGSNLTGNRTLTLLTGDANRALTIAGNTTIPIASQALTFAGPTAARTITVPDASFTVARTDAANTFTGHQTVEGVTSTGATGTGAFVFANTPTLVTPEIGAATGTSLVLTGSIISGSGGSGAGNLALTQGTAPSAGTTNITITAPTSVTSYVRKLPGSAATGFYLGTNSTGVVTDTQVASNGTGNVLLSAGTAAIASGKTLTVSNTLTLVGTDGTTMTFPSTSATLARTDAANTFTGTQTFTAPVLGTPASGNAANMTADGTNAVGFLGIPQNSKSAAYTTVLADSGKHIYHPTGDNNARTFTIDSNANVAYPVGTAITFVNKINTVTIAITSDTLTHTADGTTGNYTLAANKMATAVKVTSTEWFIAP